MTVTRARLTAGHIRLEQGHRRQLATAVGPVTVTRCAPRACRTAIRATRCWGCHADGIVEGAAARHLVADRLDITGSRWSVPGAEVVLILRALISNSDFAQYRTFHTHGERERRCPGPISTTTNSWPDRRTQSGRAAPVRIRRVWPGGESRPRATWPSRLKRHRQLAP